MLIHKRNGMRRHVAHTREFKVFFLNDASSLFTTLDEWRKLREWDKQYHLIVSPKNIEW